MKITPTQIATSEFPTKLVKVIDCDAMLVCLELAPVFLKYTEENHASIKTLYSHAQRRGIKIKLKSIFLINTDGTYDKCFRIELKE